MTEYKIERGVPIPISRPGRPNKYPWPDMGHGDSVLVEMTDADKARLGQRGGSPAAAQAARLWIKGNRPEWTAVTRKEGDATRIWFLDPSKNGGA